MLLLSSCLVPTKCSLHSLLILNANHAKSIRKKRKQHHRAFSNSFGHRRPEREADLLLSTEKGPLLRHWIPSSPRLAVEMAWTPGIFLCLCFWTVNGAKDLRVVEITMMPDAFDDQYIGCTKEMEKAAPELMEDEMNKHRLLKTVWKISKRKWEIVNKSIGWDLPRGFKEEHGRAVIAYTYSGFNKDLNQAVRESGRSLDTYKSHFHFKAFHYYLTRALQLLRKKCNVMYKTSVYRGIGGVSCEQSESESMRFGYFASSSLEKTVAEKFRKGTGCFFTINTCFGVNISKFSHFKKEEEVLIPVQEIFRVFPGDAGDNSYVLRSTNQTCSNFNCAYLGTEKKNSYGYDPEL
ncbi:ecto-ADP-ribosyltransferase 5-like [Alligator mississippiensis]|uniref:NAD(P)(+)--arginine ADP-ribosyltransferase n=1 Tax=Alligator mississippiensis TaxID=8496 RepID=A0A151NKD3_ALLMI|nr:ecto-ADP-ribosyltransferase 5-like [Alligator mississippiensis]